MKRLIIVVLISLFPEILQAQESASEVADSPATEEGVGDESAENNEDATAQDSSKDAGASDSESSESVAENESDNGPSSVQDEGAADGADEENKENEKNGEGESAQDESAGESVANSSASIDQTENEKDLNTRVTGSLRSEMYLSQRSQMTQAGAGSYHLDSLNVYPFYEIIQVRADEVGHKGLSIHFQGVAGLDLGEVYFDQRFVADPTYLYVQFKDYGADIRLGRQMVFTGSTRGLHMDGLYASYVTPIQIGIEAHGGLVVSPKQGPTWYRNPPSNVDYTDFGKGFTDWQREGDYSVGGRVFYQVPGTVAAGVSILLITHLDEIDKQLAGVDLDVTPVEWMGLTGNATLDMMTVTIRDVSMAVDLFFKGPINASVEYRHLDPTLYLSNMSIFSVFSTEEYDSVGGSVRITPSTRLSIDAGYDQLFNSYFDQGNNGNATFDLGYEVHVDGTMYFGNAKDVLVRTGYRRLAQQEQAVDQVNLGAVYSLPLKGMRVMANTYLDFYQENINGASVGFLGDAGLFYANEMFDVGGTVTAGTTPFAEAEARGMLRFAYNFDSHLKRGK